ncbi:pimeloyl-ACP methyl ester carboxylesterase [Mucilaginibacter yixingensis]|uniref:Pimeloyl-ACP methyl ester carboxylesterase n=1 Tax=Mucilaginibacter yixingensis TaxID=1295612 RepID=A0A2T5J7J2_9SPHI|nr:alpha/beta hydrolase [Mucilaginibacter yixingensis]PTQ95117.1 pimeloyl-ACP methyl ester carboxylesterase [Mucilaginibacter yixingensis]
MAFIKAQRENGTELNLYYQDYGAGRPVVLLHGWPLNSNMWQYQLAELPKYGLRCIAYDRRGFGQSDKPFDGYDYDTLADDLKAVLDGLDLQDVVLVAFSMAGGEAVRYFSKYGGERVTKLVLVSSIAPYMLQTDDNPDGVEPEMVEQILAGLWNDHAGFMQDFGKQFFGVSLMHHPVSQGVLDWSFMSAMQASLKATIDCVYSFTGTDFRDEMQYVDVPTLIIHGDADKVVPMEATGQQAAEMITDNQFLIYEDEPHGLWFTSKDQLNTDLLEFIGAEMYMEVGDEDEEEE